MNRKLIFCDLLCAIIPAIPNTIFALLITLAIVGEGGAQFAGWAFGTLMFLVLIPTGCWQSVPSIFWRYKKEHETRVLAIGKWNYAQVKIWGIWFDVICNAKGDEVHVALWGEATAFDYGFKSVNKAEEMINELAKYILMGRTPGVDREVMTRKKIVNGRVE